MDETTKTKKLWTDLEWSILTGKGIDIGCGPDPVTKDVRRFDIDDGDANHITQYVKEDFDFVFASHSLEHMHDPREAILEWWKLVRVGGHLFIIVPDEDLYEQGAFPSRFNSDHKATFTVSKQKSWSPVSINCLDLASSLPNGQLISLVLQDQGYHRSLMKHGLREPNLFVRHAVKLYTGVKKRTNISFSALEYLRDQYTTIDQTRLPDAVAQIQFIVKKVA